MSNITDIQWCDSTVNPIMGCGGCELFPPPKKVTDAINVAVGSSGVKIDSHGIFKGLVNAHYSKLKNPGKEHKNAVTTTNIWHLREEFVDSLKRDHGQKAADAAMSSIRMSITCYAAKLHLNKGYNIHGPLKEDGTERKVNKGYAPTFEQLTKFEGRMEDTAKLSDLLGTSNPATPWKDGLARMIFVSDMGDALSARGDFGFLNKEVVPAFKSEDGKHHLWLWLTKRPGIMAEFAKEIGGFPDNVCAMTTLTGPDEESLKRLADLKKVKAKVRGLSIEPLWDRIDPRKLDLKGIHWVIVGGESGSGEDTRPFALEWAEEMVEHCRNNNVACFVKQIGRKPTKGGKPYVLPVKRDLPSGKFTDKLTDPHGGDWSEWPESIKVRGFPQHFHDYRKGEKKKRGETKPRPVSKSLVPKTEGGEVVSAEEKAEFKRLDGIVRKGIQAFMEVGNALRQIHDRKLWRADGYKTWEAYCRKVAGVSTPHAHRLMEGTEIADELEKTLPRGNDSEAIPLPVHEAQTRPLKKLKTAEERARAWTSAVAKSGGEPTMVEVQEAVFEILGPEKENETPKPGGKTAKRKAIVSQLQQVVTKRQSWDEAQRLITELVQLDSPN